MKSFDRLLGILGRGFTLFCSIFIVAVIGMFAISHQEPAISAFSAPMSIVWRSLFLTALLMGVAYFTIPLTASIDYLAEKGHLWLLHAAPWMVFAGSALAVAWFFSEVMYPGGLPPLRAVALNFTVGTIVVFICLFGLMLASLTKINSREGRAMHRWMMGLDPGELR